MVGNRIVLLGAGVMGQALGAALVDSGDLVIVEADRERAQQAAATLGVRAMSLAEALADPATVIIAVKPQQMTAALDELAGLIKPGSRVISIAAGVTTDRLEAALPEVDVVRAMPNTPARIRQGVVGISGGANCADDAVHAAAELMGHVGTVIVLPESEIDALTAVAGSGPAYVFYLAEAMLDAARELGLSDAAARSMVVQTIAGSGALLAESDRDPAELRAQVTSPGGTTEAAIAVLTDADVAAHMRRAIRAARDRSREL